MSYEVVVGWERNTDFAGLYDDITGDVKSISFSRGKSDERGQAEVGQCSIVINNSDGTYSPPLATGDLYGNLLPRRPVRVRYTQQLLVSTLTKEVAAVGDYAAEDVLSESASAGTAWSWAATKLKGGFGYISKAQVICEVTGLTPALTLYLFKDTPTCNLNDNVANTALLHADLDNYIGKIDFPAMEDLGTGDSETLATPGTYGNLPLSFVCALDDTTIYGVLVTHGAITDETADMEISINLTFELPHYDLFYGYIEEIIPHPHKTEQDCIINCVDGLDYLARHDMATALYKDTKTGLLQEYILDDALWNEDMRLLGTGQDTVPYWYGHDVKARYAQTEIDNNEQGFTFIDGAGHFRFEDRWHRSRARQQTSQATFDNSMAQINYSLNPKHVYNIIKVTVTPWELQSEAELWRLEEVPSIPVGETSTWWGDSEYFVDAWVTPVSTTDYTANSQSDGGGDDLTSDLTVATTKFAKTIKLAITNNATVPAYITLLKARGTYYDDQTKVTRKAEDSTSQTAYQKRTLAINGKYMADADNAQDLADYAISKYKNPRGEISVSIMNQDDTILTQILGLEISDRITVVNDDLGLSADYFIDHMEHNISMGGKLHTVNYRLADCENEDFWCLDYSSLASTTDSGQTKLGY